MSVLDKLARHPAASGTYSFIRLKGVAGGGVILVTAFIKEHQIHKK
jgi:hypothetical protein